MKQAICGILVVFFWVVLAALAVEKSDAAQPMCADGTLVGDSCELEGRPPIQGAGTCPDEPDIVQAGCYRVSELPCAADESEVNGMCQKAVKLIPGGFACPDAGYEVVGDRCVRYVDPTCGPLGCRGKITLTYTVGCVGQGLSRVELGQPKTTVGARVSLITVNGSPTIGADLRAGTGVSVIVTPERLNDEVVVTGPTVAPACGLVEATPAPTVEPATPTPVPATPVPAQPTPTVAVAPEPTAAVQPAPSSTPRVSRSQATASPEEPPAVTVEAVESRDGGETVAVDEPELDDAPTPCPADQVLVDQQCIPPCAQAEPGAPCFDVTGGTSAVETEPVIATPVPVTTESNLPILPLAIVAGATLVLAPAAFVFVSRKS